MAPTTIAPLTAQFVHEERCAYTDHLLAHPSFLINPTHAPPVYPQYSERPHFWELFKLFESEETQELVSLRRWQALLA